MPKKGYYKNIDLKSLSALFGSGKKIPELVRIFKVDRNTLRTRLRDLGFNLKRPKKRRKEQAFQGQNWLRKMKKKCYWMEERTWSERHLHGEHARMERAHG